MSKTCQHVLNQKEYVAIGLDKTVPNDTYINIIARGFLLSMCSHLYNDKVMHFFFAPGSSGDENGIGQSG